MPRAWPSRPGGVDPIPAAAAEPPRRLASGLERRPRYGGFRRPGRTSDHPPFSSRAEGFADRGRESHAGDAADLGALDRRGVRARQLRQDHTARAHRDARRRERAHRAPRAGQSGRPDPPRSQRGAAKRHRGAGRTDALRHCRVAHQRAPARAEGQPLPLAHLSRQGDNRLS